jgi:pyrimidine operon attenuation protein/uracil phosphoribosyltransferase
MARGRIILDGERFAITVERMCHQLIENYGDFSDTCIVGIQPRGTFLADRIYSRLTALVGSEKLLYGKLDITFYRDDFRMRDKLISGSATEMEFLIDDKRVILVDDVLYTGRTVQAALSALQHYGRASQIELMALIDRRFNRHLPIQCNYSGLIVDALDHAYVKVEWLEQDGKDQIKLFAKSS